MLGVRSDIKVLGCSHSGPQAVVMARELLPDLILMDVELDTKTGLETTASIKAELPDIKIIMLTDSEEREELFETIRRGAQGYIMKNTPVDDIYHFLLGIVAGDVPLNCLISEKLLGKYKDLGLKLSTRELEVLKCLASGLCCRETADQIFLSENTIKRHLRNILAKLHLQYRLEELTGEKE